MGVVEFIQRVSNTYISFTASLPFWGQQFINLFLWILLIVIYLLIIWKFYRFIARKNILELNLSQYNKTDHAVFSKVIGGTLYLTEYVFILPILVFIWFSVFSVFLILMSENLEVQKIMFIAAIIVGAIRFLAYTPKYGQKLAKEISKLIPLTLLVTTLTNPGFIFNFEKVISNIIEIPTFFNQILLYLIFIIILEMALRVFDFILGLMGFEDKEDKDDE
jgi:hypothetical protein